MGVLVKQVSVTIADDGSVKIETNGFSGSECLKATEDLERALGMPGSRQKKKEFFETAKNDQQNRLSAGN